MAVKVTAAPEQIEVDDATTDTAGVTVLAVIVIGVLVAVVGLAQAAVDVITTVT